MVSRAYRAASLAATLVFASPARAACADLLPAENAPAGPIREVTAEDLIQLRDIGFPDAAVTGASPLAISPDGTHAAFVISRAELQTDSYCEGLVVIPLASGKPRLLDSGGEFIPLQAFVRSLLVSVGLPNPVTPAWSPDGRSLAYLKRRDGITQADIVDVATGATKARTQSPTDVEDLQWSADGRLLFTTRPGLSTAREAIEREGRSGWLYDARIAPNYGPAPRITQTDASAATFVLDLSTGMIGPASPTQSRAPYASAVLHLGARAQLRPDGDSLVAPQRVWAITDAGTPVRCNAATCRGRISGVWWDSEASAVRFLRREGWNGEIYAFYVWRPGSAAPVRTYLTTETVENCVPAQEQLLCTLESAALPRRIVLLDPQGGAMRTVFDPNPEFSRIRLGPVRRLKWRNDRGLSAWGDLVLPPHSRAGTKLPLVIVQYHSRGFLRGGTGDEYPIYLLAARGFAVLSFERPRDIADTIPGLRTEAALNAADERGWADRKSLLSSILAGVAAAVKTGRIDPRRIGITGLSDGATSARFALINSKRFAAAAISSCCLEPKTVMTYGGIAWARFNRTIGYPPATKTDPSFWRPASLALNAAKIKTPLLMQLSDDEYLLSLEAFEALREKGDPVELYVFPGEHHVKWQPIHRLAIYERNIDWFAFWLECLEDSSPAKVAEYGRWRAMRRKAQATARLCPRLTHVSSSNVPSFPRL